MSIRIITTPPSTPYGRLKLYLYSCQLPIRLKQTLLFTYYTLLEFYCQDLFARNASFVILLEI